MLAADAGHGIITQAWSPIGGITSYRGEGRSSTFEESTIGSIAAHSKTAAQVMPRWHPKTLPMVMTGRAVAERWRRLTRWRQRAYRGQARLGSEEHALLVRDLHPSTAEQETGVTNFDATSGASAGTPARPTV